VQGAVGVAQSLLRVRVHLLGVIRHLIGHFRCLDSDVRRAFRIRSVNVSCEYRIRRPAERCCCQRGASETHLGRLRRFQHAYTDH